MTPKGFGHGKVILLGEHAVVHGVPALVGALDLGVEVAARLDVEQVGALRITSDGELLATSEDGSDLGRALKILASGLPGSHRGVVLDMRSDLPRGVGLGSSAALSVAVVRALSSLGGLVLTEPDIAALANAAEAVFHGRPSGVDTAAATLGGLLLFGTAPEPRRVRIPAPIRLIIAVVEPRPATRVMVDRVRHFVEAHPGRGDAILVDVERLVLEASEAAARGDLDSLGGLMSANHRHLQTLGVSTPRLDAACRAAVEAGASGAKLTGAGGGGVVIALAPSHEAEVRRAFEALDVLAVHVVEIGKAEGSAP